MTARIPHPDRDARCGVWRRAAARTIDAVVAVGMFTIGLVVLIAGSLSASPGTEPAQTPEWLLMGWMGALVCGYAVYEIAMVASCGQTIGKKMFDVRIAPSDGSPRVGWKRSVLRFASLTGLILLAGPFLVTASAAAGVRRSGSSWHDRPGNTLTVRGGTNPPPPPPQGKARPAAGRRRSRSRRHTP